jgi:hypothetical protein
VSGSTPNKEIEMSGALSSVFGGGGGSILGDIGGIIGMEFGPIGSMIGEAIGNMVQQAVSGALSDAVDQLQQQHGMPPFLGNMVKDKANEFATENQANVPADVQQSAQDQYGPEMQDLQAQLGAFIASSASEKHKASGGSSHGGSWLEAIAAAMGEALGKQADRMVALSDKMSAEMPAGSSGSSGTGGGTPTNTTSGSPTSNNSQASQFNKDMTDFQAVSQQYSILQNTFSTALKGLGEALQGMARKS